jgi:hypothetical protein
VVPTERRTLKEKAMNKLIIATVLVSAAMLSTACGAKSGETASPFPFSTQDAQRLYVQCLNEAGVTIQDNGNGEFSQSVDGSSQPDPEAQAKAAAECAKKTGLALPGSSESGPQGTEQRDAMLAFAECMRKNGINVPDPGDGGLVIDQSTDPAKVQKAMQACQSTLPGSTVSAIPEAGASR